MMNIEVGGQRVEEIDTEFAVTLVLSSGAKLRIETALDLLEPSAASMILDPQALGSDLGLLRVLSGRLIESATADENSGALCITFDAGVTLRVAPDPDFEAWSAAWPDGSTLVALPGGGLARWGAKNA